MACPSWCIRVIRSGCSVAFTPTQKNVPLTFSSDITSSRIWVHGLLGPSSNVRAILRWSRGPWLLKYPNPPYGGLSIRFPTPFMPFIANFLGLNFIALQRLLSVSALPIAPGARRRSVSDIERYDGRFCARQSALRPIAVIGSPFPFGVVRCREQRRWLAPTLCRR